MRVRDQVDGEVHGAFIITGDVHSAQAQHTRCKKAPEQGVACHGSNSPTSGHQGLATGAHGHEGIGTTAAAYVHSVNFVFVVFIDLVVCTLFVLNLACNTRVTHSTMKSAHGGVGLVTVSCVLAFACASTQLLASPGPASPSLYIAPVHYNHTLEGPIGGSGDGAPTDWFVAQWNNPTALGLEPTRGEQGPCSAYARAVRAVRAAMRAVTLRLRDGNASCVCLTTGLAWTGMSPTATCECVCTVVVRMEATRWSSGKTGR